MITMAGKGGSWVGDFYQRLEAMCVEVEEVICEDTLKYVENQVRNVGDTVKKFYSEVMEDLRSPSSLDQVEEDDNLVSVVDHNDDVKTHDELNADDETEPVDASSEKLVENCDNAAGCDDNKNYRYCGSAIYSVIESCEPKTPAVSAGEKCNEVNSGSNNTESTSLNQITAVEEDLDCGEDSQNNSDNTESPLLNRITAVEEELDCREDSHNNCVSYNTESTSLNQVTAVEEDLDCSEDYQNNCISNSQSMCSTVTDDSDELPYNETEEPSPAHGYASVKEAFKVSHNEDSGGIFTEMVEGNECSEAVKEHNTNMLSSENLSTDSNISSINADLSTTSTSDMKNSIVDEELSIIDLDTSSPLAWESRRFDAGKLGASVGEQFNKFNLEESCVLVENHDHSSKPAFSQIQRSYKKRIQDVFSTRRWSKSKRDQELLAAWYEEQFANLVSSSAIMQQVESQKSHISESFESDWELL